MNPKNLQKAVDIKNEMDDLNSDIRKLRKLFDSRKDKPFRSQLVDENNYTFTFREINALIKCKGERISELMKELEEL